jgi:nucleotide-binding universal stress UspA family protein
MFSKIVVVLNDRPEAQRALRAAITLACSHNSEIATVSILGNLPAYAAFAFIGDPSGPTAITENRRRSHDELHRSASRLAEDYGVHATGTVIEGRAEDALPRFLRDVSADLLVLALRQRNPASMRLRDSVYDLAQRASCNVLSVH